MSKCSKCGYELSMNSKFCDNCGAKTEEISAATPAQNAAIDVKEQVNNNQQEFQKASTQSVPTQGGPLPAQGSYNSAPNQSNIPNAPYPPQQAYQAAQAPMQQQPMGQPMQQQPMGQPPMQQQYQQAPMQQQPMGQPMQPQPMQQQPVGQPMQQQPMRQQMPMQNQYAGVGVATKKNGKNPLVFVGIGVGALIVVVLLIVLVSSLFSGGSDDPNIGVWQAEEITMMGMTMKPTDIYPEGISLELKSNGKCTLTMDGDDYSADYEIDGTSFKMIDGGEEFPGTIVGNEIEITNLLDMGIDIKFVKEGMTGEGSDNAPGTDGAGAVIDENNLTGTYMLSSMTTAGVVMNYDALQQSEIEMTLVITGEQAELTAYGATSPVELDTSAKTILLQGIVMDYVIDGENIVATGENAGHELVFVFTAENSSIWGDTSQGGVNATGFIPPGYGAEQTVPVETLSNPSQWYGIVTISDYVGNDDISGEHEAWAYIGSDDIGTYFELYLYGYVDSDDYLNFMSFNIELHDYSFFPVVDEHAWLYGGATLKEEDNTWYVPSITNGVLSATYNYDYNGESFVIDFELAQVVEAGSDTGGSDTGGSDTGEEPEDNTPEPTAPTERLTMEELKQIYYGISDLEIEEKFALTYEQVRDTYFGGVEGNITNQGDTFISYQWLSEESDTSLLNISFQDDGEPEFTYKSMSINNIPLD